MAHRGGWGRSHLMNRYIRHARLMYQYIRQLERRDHCLARPQLHARLATVAELDPAPLQRFLHFIDGLLTRNPLALLPAHDRMRRHIGDLRQLGLRHPEERSRSSDMFSCYHFPT